MKADLPSGRGGIRGFYAVRRGRHALRGAIFLQWRDCRPFVVEVDEQEEEEEEEVIVEKDALEYSVFDKLEDAVCYVTEAELEEEEDISKEAESSGPYQEVATTNACSKIPDSEGEQQQQQQQQQQSTSKANNSNEREGDVYTSKEGDGDDNNTNDASVYIDATQKETDTLEGTDPEQSHQAEQEPAEQTGNNTQTLTSKENASQSAAATPSQASAVQGNTEAQGALVSGAPINTSNSKANVNANMKPQTTTFWPQQSPPFGPPPYANTMMMMMNMMPIVGGYRPSMPPQFFGAAPPPRYFSPPPVHHNHGMSWSQQQQQAPPKSAAANQQRQKEQRKQKQEAKQRRELERAKQDVARSKQKQEDKIKRDQTEAKRDKERRQQMNDRWESMFQELVKYKEEHGTCQVPTRSNTYLSRWCHRQKNIYRALGKADLNTNTNQNSNSSNSDILTGGRIQRLQNLGFKFVEKTMAEKKSFDQWLPLLKQFKEEHGHCRVPKNYPRSRRLSSWVSMQRQHYKWYHQLQDMGEEAYFDKKARGLAEIKRPTMNPEKIAILNELGFDWQIGRRCDTAKNRKPWDERFQELVEYKEEHGTTLVPRDYPQLGDWVKYQRMEYNKYKRGHKTSMTAERILQFQEIGFVFDSSKIHVPHLNNRKRLHSTALLANEDQDSISRDDDNAIEEEEAIGQGGVRGTGNTHPHHRKRAKRIKLPTTDYTGTTPPPDAWA